MSELKGLVEKRLRGEGAHAKPWAGLILAALDGPDQLEQLLTTGRTTAGQEAERSSPAGAHAAYLVALTVEGFRGIGPRQKITFEPGPGLTIVVGRNGSGKSSFAEALEVLFTGDSRRWVGRSKIWREGWRNLHQNHPSGITADMLLEGQGRTSVVGSWGKDADLDEQDVHVQPLGKPKTTLAAQGWAEALVSYRPFLSYNELGSMLDEGPSKLYDALSLVLGLEDLVAAQNHLAKSRTTRQAALDGADDTRQELIETLSNLLAREADDRAQVCLDALASNSWGLTRIAEVLDAGAASPQQDTSVLTRALALDPGDPQYIAAAVTQLRESAARLRDIAGTDADRARQTAQLLTSALEFHEQHQRSDCPVCGNSGALTASWREASSREVERLRAVAADCEKAHAAAASAQRTAKGLIQNEPKLLKELFDIGLDGLAEARETWARWSAGAAIDDLNGLASHLETQHESFRDALEVLKRSAAAELKRREDRWSPIARQLSEWLETAREARAGAELLPAIQAAEKWLKDASSKLRDDRFAPIADKAMATWQHLRQQSNVELGRIELEGAKTKRRVVLDVTVDGVPGAALGVMSQGELHSLALSLFLPRATMPESPFRFVVVDDPVQSMDPARVDGLARALENAATTRQVIVFTHDDRLAEAVRRLQIKSTILSITRRPQSVVEIRAALDPVSANIEDALALVHTTDLPKDVLRRVVPGFCRAALEASFISTFRRKRMTKGQSSADIEHSLKSATTLTHVAALALFDDREKGGDVMKRLNQFGPWAGDVFRQCKEGAHGAATAELHGMIRDTERLAGAIASVK